jgi:hypothetical protein
MSDLLDKWLAEYQEDQPNKFNEEIIYGLREKDDMVGYLEDVCKALEAIPYIKYEGYDYITNENKFRKMKAINIEETRLSLVVFKFTVDFNGEVHHKEMPIFIPKWINRYYFVLNSNKYYPIYQNVESSTYNTRNSVILKSLLMSITLTMKPTKIKDINEEEYNGRCYLINLFNHKNIFLYYYFATLGFKETLEFFGYEKYIIITNKTYNKNRTIVFPLIKDYNLVVNKRMFQKDHPFRYFVFSLYEMFDKKTDVEKIDDKDYWMVLLGGLYTKNSNNQYKKAETVIMSFKRILDERTKKNLLLDDEDKKDIFHIIRWMFFNFDKLMKKDNLSLLNKRLRLSEYIITPFVRKMSFSTYRILNSKTLNINKILGILNPNPMVIISSLQNSKLLRFNNSTNDMDLFNCALKWSNRGPSAMGEGSKKTISAYYRGIHISHMGRVSLPSSPAGDPGMTGILSPFIKTNGFYYSETGKIETANDEDDIED